MKQSRIRLGVNIDHVATVRNARGIATPDPVRAALMAKDAGADGITAHLREDRRHIRDDDIRRLKVEVDLPLNMEMAATDEMLEIALNVKPNACCIVPEKRQELTTEGGLDVESLAGRLKDLSIQLKQAGIRVSLFIDPDIAQIGAAKEVGADIVELHTGRYCELYAEGKQDEQEAELQETIRAAAYADESGLECHAGHGLNYDTVSPIAAIPQIKELNIGHFLMGESIFLGLDVAIKKMRRLIDDVTNR